MNETMRNRNAEIKKLLKRRVRLSELLSDLNSNTNTDDYDVYHLKGMMISIDNILSDYVNKCPEGKWLMQIKGMTIEYAAGLLAYFDIRGKTRAIQFIKFSGSDNHGDAYNNNIKQIMDKLSKSFRQEPDSLYGKLNDDKFYDLLRQDINITTARIRADRHMRKIFISHLFEEMYLEEHGKLPERYNDSNCVIIQPEVPYTVSTNNTKEEE